MFCNHCPDPDAPFTKLDIALLDEAAIGSLLDAALGLKFAFGDVPIVKKPFFSSRECEVMSLLNDGVSQAEIGRSLFISRERVKQIRQRISTKTNRFHGNKVALAIAKEQSYRFHEQWLLDTDRRAEEAQKRFEECDYHWAKNRPMPEASRQIARPTRMVPRRFTESRTFDGTFKKILDYH